MSIVEVTGFGGVIIESQDPERLIDWYRDYLGVPIGEGAPYTFFYYREPHDPDQMRKILWEVAPAEEGRNSPETSTVIFSFRVDNLERSLAALRAAGVRVDDEVRKIQDGWIGWVYDPDGHKVELWEHREPSQAQ
jgi:catechol 2,3-dioxygenase-like lactoylglutathione lyase family enzyme